MLAGSYSIAKVARMASLLKVACHVSIVTTLLCGAANAQQPKGDEEPELQFNGHCRECHSFVKNDNRLGPTLYGVVGRKAGTVPGFAYSESVKDSGIVWDEATLDKWITNPGAVIPDNNMAALFGGIDDPAIRAKIVAFLKQDTQMAAPQAKK
jgi:cytochrome c